MHACFGDSYWIAIRTSCIRTYKARIARLLMMVHKQVNYLAVQIIQVCNPHAQYTLPETGNFAGNICCRHALFDHGAADGKKD